MGAILAYLRRPSRCIRSQSSGLSPSPTEETAGQKVFGDLDGTKQDDSKLSISAAEEQNPAEEPESNDTSYGVEATAVRTLAASTGTVAILGTTAKVLEISESVLGELPVESGHKDNPSISVTTADADIEATRFPLEQKETDEVSTSNEATQESFNTENNVEQQNETILINNEEQKRIPEIQSDIPTATPKTTPEPREEVPCEKKTDIQNEQPLTEIKLKEPEQCQVIESVEISKDESQLPKIVDVQEKKPVTVPITSDKSDSNDIPLFKEAVEKEITPEEQNESKEPIAAETEESTLQEDEIKAPSDSEAGSPDISKTDEDNEISSEQLKTNSLSDMSLSEVMNSEGEEAAREAAKAQELQEMVASLSASANESANDYKAVISESSNSNDNVVGTSSRKSIELEPKTHETIIEEKISPETNGEDNILSEIATKIQTTEFEIQHSPSETSEPQSTESNDSSKQTEESKISDKEEKESPKHKKNKDEQKYEKELEETKMEEDIKPSESANEATEEHVTQDVNDDEKIIAAATTIQSSFRGYKVRKDLKVGQNGDILVTEIDEEIKDQEHPSDETPEYNQNVNQECIQNEPKHHENDIVGKNILELETLNEADPLVASAPESLIRIAQAEVDRICTEAERATENLMTPPPTIDTDALDADYQDDNEDFPAPPDDLLDMNGKNETARDEQDSSATEPTVPLGTNTDGDSSKTEDTTAPSFADSEIKSQDPTALQKIDVTKQESLLTDNINTEIVVNRDSTDGELTMEEDSKEEDIGSVLLTSKEPVEEKSENNDLPDVNQEKAAIVIQANYRGFKTRQGLRQDTVKEIVSPETESEPKSVTKDNVATKLPSQKLITTSVHSEEKPKRPDQIDVFSRTEDISLIQGEDISPAQDSPSDSKDDTSSTTLSEEELNEKARKIQAGVRGYLVRKDQKVKRDAAVKIQSTFRGFKTRQRLKQDDVAIVEVAKTS